MTNCDRFRSQLEAYFCETLADEDLRFSQTHLESCRECGREVESLKSVDPLVRAVLQRRLMLARMAAQANTRPRALKLGLAAVGLAATVFGLSVGMVLLRETPPPPVFAQQQQPPPVPVETEVRKDAVEQETPGLLKPKDGKPAEPAPQPHLDSPQVDGPDFAIMDAAGYNRTLEFYRGRIVLFGVLSPEQKAAVSNLQQIYDDFGSNPGVRVFAVARRREDKLNSATLPTHFNNGSKLLGVREGQFLLIDAAGKTRLEGSLADSASVGRIRSQLGQLGVR
jgi:hypothetical protein